MTEQEEKYIHFVIGSKFQILNVPVLASQVKCPDCGGEEGYSAIFEPHDGPERFWCCAKCKGKVPRSWRWRAREKPAGMEGHPSFSDKEWPRMRHSLSA